MTNNQTKCGIIYEKLVMRAGDDERIINNEWPYKESLLTSCYNKAKISGCIKEPSYFASLYKNLNTVMASSLK